MFKHLTKALFFGLTLFVGTQHAFCGSKDEMKALKKVVKEENKTYPVSVSKGMILKKAQLKDGFHTYFYELNEAENGTDLSQLNTEVQKVQILTKIITRAECSEELGLFIGLILSNNMGLKYVYNAIPSKKTAIVTITNAEIKEAKEALSKNITYEEIEKAIAIRNSNCPKQIENGITLSKITVSDGYINSDFTIDEDVNPNMDALVIPELTDIMLKSICESAATDFSAKYLLKGCIQHSVGFRYRYTGNKTGKVVEIFIPTERLNECGSVK